MPIHSFNHNFDVRRQQFVTMDKVPDNRSEIERKFSPLSTYNHDKPDIGYAERFSEEIINLSGAWVVLHRRMPDLATPDQEQVWDEDPDPIYDKGLRLKAYFRPDTVALELTRFGIDTPIKASVVFSRAALFNEIGNRLIRPGDVINVPYNQMPASISNANAASRNIVGDGFRLFRVLNAYDDGNFHYRWLYYHCATELLPDDKALNPQLRG